MEGGAKNHESRRGNIDVIKYFSDKEGWVEDCGTVDN